VKLVTFDEGRVGRLDGVRLNVRGCDIWTFRDDKVVVKNSFWKIVEP
jgi:hypothetical protein